MVVNVTIDTHINITNFSDIPLAAKSRILDALRRSNPEIQAKKRLCISTRGIPLHINFYKKYSGNNGEILSIDRGCKFIIAPLLKELKFSLKVTDNSVVNPVPDFPDSNIALEDYQAKALEEIGDYVQGTLVFPTGGGKTVTAAELISRRKQKTLILVHTSQLLLQWTSALKSLLPGVKIGVCQGKRKKNRVGDHVTVATVQTISQQKNITPAEFYKQFGLVILDECHRVGAPTFQDCVSMFPARYRYGLTATPKRRDGKGFLIKAAFGPPLTELGYKDISSRVILPRVIPIPTILSEDYASSIYIKRYNFEKKQQETMVNYSTLFNMFAQDMMRNISIMSALKPYFEDEMKYILLLTRRVEHAVQLANYLKSEGLKAESLIGGGGKKKELWKESVLQATRDGLNRALVGTSIADEGLDVVNLNVLGLTYPTSWSGILAQRIGRVIRRCEGKETPEVLDFVDIDIPELIEAWRAREKFYLQHGFEIDYSRLKGTVLEK